jgi:hypothetical protein
LANGSEVSTRNLSPGSSAGISASARKVSIGAQTGSISSERVFNSLQVLGLVSKGDW